MSPMLKQSTRREFVAGACLLAGTLAIGGVSKAFGSSSTGLLRPPGGQDEDAFLAACLRCDRCRTACPRGVIKLAVVTDGFLEARTPVLDFHAGLCDFCDECIDVCPTGALTSFDPATDRIGVAQVDPGLCFAYTRGWCDLCKNSCAYGALSFDEFNRPVIDESLCNGCGACVDACQINVFASYSGTGERAVEVRPGGGRQ